MSPLPSAFLEAIISLLMPYFIGTAVDIAAARTEIIDTLASYATRTRAEMLQAAQIIAFGMSTLDTLADAKAAELSPSLRNRFRGCANSLSRSEKQHQDSLDRLLACDVCQATEPTTQPPDDASDAEFQNAIGSARAAIESYRNRLFGTSPANTSGPGTIPGRDKSLWAAAMRDTSNWIGLPNGSAQGA